jgi:endonuclease-3 related protein
MAAHHRSPTRRTLLSVYERLLEAYGPQRWWPADSPFEVILGAILTQNTAWSNVVRALAGLRAADLWSFEAILAAPEATLAEAIRPSGYFNVKARKVRAFAEVVTGEYGGDLDALLALPRDPLRARLLAIWGIGEETADDIVLYAAGHPIFVVDAYTRRIVDRLGWPVAGRRYADYQRLFMARLPEDAPLLNEYHALLVRHGAQTCTRRTPRCTACCLRRRCLFVRRARGERR